MTKSGQTTDMAFSPLAENLLCDPLEYLHADHFRQEAMRNVLYETAVRAAPPEGLTSVLAFMEADLPRHLSDEEEDLFPRLIDGASPNDSLADVITVLKDGHLRLRQTLDLLIAELPTYTGKETRTVTTRFHHLVGAFCELSRWIVAMEEQVVIPAARKHLDTKALDAVARTMARRRDTRVPSIAP